MAILFPLRSLPVKQLFPGEEVQPVGELLVAVVDDAGVDRDRA